MGIYLAKSKYWCYIGGKQLSIMIVVNRQIYTEGI